MDLSQLLCKEVLHVLQKNNTYDYDCCHDNHDRDYGKFDDDDGKKICKKHTNIETLKLC